MKLYAGQACNKLMLDLQDADMMNASPLARDLSSAHGRRTAELNLFRAGHSGKSLIK
jgi:hypothetical protein